MSNGPLNGLKVRGVSLTEEEFIRANLPAKVKEFVLSVLQRANTMMHAESYGADFYRALSPYRPL